MAIVIQPGGLTPTGDRVYATVNDLQVYLGAEATMPSDEEAARMLARASEHLDGLLAYARYQTDTSGKPTDAKIAAAIKVATCAQVEQWLEVGEDHPIAGFPSDTSMTRSKTSESKRPAFYAPRAIALLQRAGIRPHINHIPVWPQYDPNWPPQAGW